MKANKTRGASIIGSKGPRMNINSGNRSSRSVSTVAMSLATSATLAAVGAFMAFPFIYTLFILEMKFHYITIPIALMLIGFFVGGVFFIGGIIGIFVAGNGSRSISNQEFDVQRIRYEVESRRFNGKI